MSDSTNTIKRSAKRFFSGTLLSRISGMARDMSMAYVFGVELSVASFLLAFRFAHLMRRLLGEGALQSAFIPQFEEIRLRNEKEAYGFFFSLTLCISLILFVLIVTLGLTLGGVLKWVEVSAENYQVIYLTILMLPSLLFICLYGLNASLLQCEQSFFTSSVAPVAFNATWIAAVISLRNSPPQDAMPYLAIGIIFACVFQWLWTVPKTWHLIKKVDVTPLKQGFSHHFHTLIPIFKPLALGMVGVSASQINNLIDSLFARYAELEGPAILWFAMRLQQLPLALFGIAIAGAVLPPLSRAIKSDNYESFIHYLLYGLLTTLGLMIPMTGLIFCMGDTIVNLIYGRGGFTDLAIQQTSICLWAYAIGLIPSAMILILAPAYYAKSNYLLPVTTSFINMLTNLSLNSIFIFFFKWGAFSVAIATSLSSWLNLYLLYSNVNSRRPQQEIVKTILKIVLITLFSTVNVLLIRSLSEHLYWGATPIMHWPKEFLTQFFNLIIQTGIFGSSCIAGLFITKFKMSELFISKEIQLNEKSI